jgi:hypothetical protein
MSEQSFPYIEQYTKFMKDFSVGQVTGEEVGEIVARMAAYFAEYNLKLVLAERQLSLKARDIEQTPDEATGKMISSAKAKILTDATDEAYATNQAKCHLENTEQFINALKSLQKGVLSMYDHSNL